MTEPAQSESRFMRRGPINQGFAVCVAASACAVVASTRDLARGMARAEGVGQLSLGAGAGITILGVIGVVLFGYLALFGSAGPIRLAGVMLAATGAYLAIATAVGAKLSQQFAAGRSTEMLLGGVLLIVAALLFVAGTFLAAFRPDWEAGQSGNSATAVAVAVGGLILPPLQGLGLGMGARLRGTDDSLESRRATGAIILASLAMLGWAAFAGAGLIFGEP